MAVALHRQVELLDLDLFAGSSVREASRIRSLLTMLAAPAGTVLIKEGTYGQEFMILASGEASVTVGGRAVATIGAGDFIGEMSLLDGDLRSATVTALTPITFYVCNSAEFAGILATSPSVAARITEAAAAREASNAEALAA